MLNKEIANLLNTSRLFLLSYNRLTINRVTISLNSLAVRIISNSLFL